MQVACGFIKEAPVYYIILQIWYIRVKLHQSDKPLRKPVCELACFGVARVANRSTLVCQSIVHYRCILSGSHHHLDPSASPVHTSPLGHAKLSIYVAIYRAF